MLKGHRMIRCRALFTALFFLLHKVCFANTFQFKITAQYEKYYGFQLKPTATDKIFFIENGEKVHLMSLDPLRLNTVGIRVDCKAEILNKNGAYSPTVGTWYEAKNGKNVPVTLDARQNVYIASNTTLIFSRKSCTRRLTGRKFVCGAFDKGNYPQYSTAQTMEMSYIKDFPEITEKNLTAIQGETKYLSCSKPSGVPEPEIFWTHNGTRIKNTLLKSGNILTVEAPRYRAAGKYQCFAENPAGTVRASVTNLFVTPRNKGLTFTTTPEDVVIRAGETVTLPCRFNRQPNDYGWLYKPKPELNQEGPVTSEAENYNSKKWEKTSSGDLIIGSVDRNDSGEYTCYGRDDDNNIVYTATVTVIYFDTSVARGPSDQTVTVGQRATVTCIAPLSYPEPDIDIFRGNVKVTEENFDVKIIQKKNEYSVIFNQVEKSDAGKYTCYVTNPEYDPWKRSGHLVVKEDGIPPGSYITTPSVAGNVSSSITLMCSAVADPDPTVEWYHANNRTRVDTSNRRYIFKKKPPSGNNRWSATMTITKVGLWEHKNAYYCVMSNKLGSSSSPKMKIFVNHITCMENKKRQIKYFKLQEPYEIACPLPSSAYPEAPIKWRYNKSSSSFRLRGNSLYTDSLMDTDRGYYHCELVNSAGYCLYNIEVQPQNMGLGALSNNVIMTITVIGLGALFFIVVMVATVCFCRRRLSRKKLESTEALERLNQPVFSVNTNGYDDAPTIAMTPSPTSNLTHNQLYGTLSKFQSWQIARNRLRNHSVLGEGQFGSVYKAQLRSLDGTPPILVAIKQIKDEQNMDAVMDYEKEMHMMTQLQHPNIIKLIGVCTDSNPYLIITEFMEKGNLSNFLQDIAQSKTDRLTLDDQIHICLQISSGLQYMAEKHYVHRDVAARNCLVGPNLVVKVADFGLSRNISGREIYQKDGGTVPIRWMSPEAIQYGQYTTANDVWAYGVTIWEVFSYGIIPYSAWSNEDVAINVQAGSRLLKPDCCPQTIYNIMCHCWADNPEHRPSFRDIIHVLKDD